MSLILLLILAFVGECLVLKPKSSRETLERQLVDHNLQFDLRFSDTNELSKALSLEDKSETCFLVNGGICHCFQESITKLVMKFPSSCRSLEVSSWFSIAIFDGDQRPILSSTPLFVTHEPSTPKINRNLLTLVLPLTLDDLSRAALLFNSLADNVMEETVLELLVITPDTHVHIIQKSLQGFTEELRFPVRVISENVLFVRPKSLWRQHPYATQMAIKLLVAQIIHTNYYLTLDADLILHHPLKLSKVIAHRDKEEDWSAEEVNKEVMFTVMEENFPRAVYHHEIYDIHAAWWDGSKQLLDVDVPNAIQGFGVTPAILSTWGSLLTLGHLRRTIAKRLHLMTTAPTSSPFFSTHDPPTATMENEVRFAPLDHYSDSVLRSIEEVWLESLGITSMWSEYTLYRSTLDAYHVFHELHVAEEDHEEEEVFLHCHNVWFVEQLPWRVDLVARNSSCLFSVIQSTTSVAPNSVLQQYQEYLLLRLPVPPGQQQDHV